MTTETQDGSTTAPAAAVPTASEVEAPLEALLLLADEPTTELTLAEALGAPEGVVVEALESLARFYDETGRGFELRRVGGGWRYWTRVEHADVIAAHVVGGQTGRLSQAALETLAVIAYQQPVSRGRVAAVRGVNVDGVIKTLVTRGLVEEAGHDAETGAAVFATTGAFLEKMGLGSLDDLPPLAPHLPDVADLEAELSALAAPVTTPAPGPQDEPATQDEPAPQPAPQAPPQADPDADAQAGRTPTGQDEEVGA